MGNQGMTNWKFSAFFAISLMLIAGLFSNAAIAADGDGTIMVNWRPGTSGNYARENPLPAADADSSVQFTYTATGVNMNKGQVRIEIPGGGWKVPSASIRVQDGTTDLILEGTKVSLGTTAANADPQTIKPGDIVLTTAAAVTAMEARRRVSITEADGNITVITVKLADTGWSAASDDDSTALAITFDSVTVPIPASLTVYADNPETNDEDDRTAYHVYPFVVRSAGDGGFLARLTGPARVNVGNIAAATAGKLTVNPVPVYVGEEEAFTVTFEAAGPRYIVTNANDFDVVFRVPVAASNGLVLKTDTVVTVSASGARLLNRNLGSTAGQYTANVIQMNKGDTITLSFTAKADAVPTTNNVTASVAGTDLTNGAVDANGDAIDGKFVLAKNGSGTATISPNPVEAGSTRDFVVTYTAATPLATSSETDFVFLRIDIPTAANEMVLPDGFSSTSTSSVRTSTSGATLIAASGANANDIVWKIPKLAEGATFQTTIVRLKASAAPSELTWNVYVTVSATDVVTFNTNPVTNPPQLFTYKKPEDDKGDVSLSLKILEAYDDTDAGDDYLVTAANTFLYDTSTEGYAAGSERTIAFEFELTDTNIKDGSVSFSVPGTWTRPVRDDGDSTVEAGELKAYSRTDTESDDYFTAIPKENVFGGYSPSVEIDNLPEGGQIVVVYQMATLQRSKEEGVAIEGRFRSGPSAADVIAETVLVDVGASEDGTGTATIYPYEGIPTGSKGNDGRTITVTFRAAGTMDNGSVTLKIPDGWGHLQTDPEKRNYIEAEVNGSSVSRDNLSVRSTEVTVFLQTFGKNSTLLFTYGGGTGAKTGFDAQHNAATASFMIESDADGDGTSKKLESDKEKGVNSAKPLLGEVLKDSPGALRVEVAGGKDGTGTAEAEITRSKSDRQQYTKADGTTVTERRIHAGDTGAYITFTYKAEQPLADGQLIFTVPVADGWSAPSKNSADPGYTRITGVPGPVEDSSDDSTIPANSLAVDVPTLPTGGEITIRYGSGRDGANAPTAAGESNFRIAIQGNKDGTPTDLLVGPVPVTVYAQASGGGEAALEITDDMTDFAAGDEGRSLTVTYTATGQIVNGQVKLTVPKNWSTPTSDHVSVTGPGTVMYGDDPTYKAPKQDVVVDAVNLAAEGTLVFNYTNVDVQPTTGSVNFTVAVDGGAGPGEGATKVKDLAVTVGQARAGSGTGDVSPKFVTAVAADDTAAEASSLEFTYTAIGTIEYPKVFDVTVDAAWAAPTKKEKMQGSYSVKHVKADGTAGSSVEALTEDSQMMRARVKQGQKVEAGDKVVFTYSANAPADTGPTSFIMNFDKKQDIKPVATLTVNVQPPSGATDLVIDAPASLLTEDGAVAITLKLQAEGKSASSATDVAVTLSSSSATGMFSATTGDDATYTSSLDVTISAGTDSIMVYYMDSTLSMETTITGSAASLTNPSAMAKIQVDTKNVSVTSVSVNPTNAMVGTAVTVTATATAAQTATFTVGSIVTDMAMTESASDPGSYSASFTVVSEHHPDGSYDVTVSINGASLKSPIQLTIDSVEPTVTATAEGMLFKNEDDVIISGTASDAGSGLESVMADVSQLDPSQKEKVTLTVDATGAYTHTVTVNADDTSKTVTVTATDNAGNTAKAEVMVSVDSTPPEVTNASADPMNVKNGDTVVVSAMVTGATSVSADVSALNATTPSVALMDDDADGTYTGSVMVTAEGNQLMVTITVTATDDAGNSGTGTAMVTLDNTAPEIAGISVPAYAKNGDMVTISADVKGATTVSATVAQLDTTQLTVPLMDDDADGTYTGMVTISMDNTAADGAKEITITATDDARNQGMGSATVNLDNTVPTVTVTITPSRARNGHASTITAVVSEAAIERVSADIAELYDKQPRTEVMSLSDEDGDGTYTGSHTIRENNEAANGTKTVTVTATDKAGNEGSGSATVDLINTIDYTSMIPQGISLFHVPIAVTAIDDNPATLSMVSDLYDALGDAVNYLITRDTNTGNWNSYLGPGRSSAASDVAITADLGIVAVMNSPKTLTFTGNAWGEGESMINLQQGLNLVGLPVNDARVTNISDIKNLPMFVGKISSIIVSSDGGFTMADGPVMGDAAYLITASAAASQAVSGEGWSNGEMAGAAPIALLGQKVDSQTAALFVEGALVDELTGLAKEGFRIKVKNLSTKSALSTVSQTDVANGYSMTFVDTKAGNAARIGDVLEISADSPDPLIGVQPVRHIVTADDVKNSRIEFADLIAYEIPAETELLRNYPNPFNPETWIPYHLSEDANVSLTIYDVNGELVRTIDVGHQTAAKYATRSKAIYWDGRNRFGEQVASGIYFYSLNAGDFSATRKMVILK